MRRGRHRLAFSGPGEKQGHSIFAARCHVCAGQSLVALGAVGVFNLVRLAGNERLQDYNDCGNPCFNIGGRDGHFLEQVMDRAAKAGVVENLRVRAEPDHRVAHRSQSRKRWRSCAGAGTMKRSFCNAHVDGWFDGAGDNADGLAVLMALARHFAKPANKPERTLVFVASAGHHTPGLNGPRSFVTANPELAKKAVMLVNIEHVAQRNFFTRADGNFRRLPRGRRRFGRGADRRRRYQQLSAAASSHRRRRRALRRQLRLGALDHAKRRDRRMGVTERRQDHDHAGAAAVSHDRRGAGRHLDSRPRTHGAVPVVLRVDGGQGAESGD